MSNEEILKRAIEKAVANGWTMFGQANDSMKSWTVVIDNYDGFLARFGVNGTRRSWDVATVIFSHDFAKAFWPTQQVKRWVPPLQYTTYNNPLPITRKGHYVTRELGGRWRWHLQQMVLEEDPIQYLAKFL